MDVWQPHDIDSWSERKKHFWKHINVTPNAFYYYFCPPGVDKKLTAWTDEERTTFILTCYKRPSTAGLWGLFSLNLVGRTGQQCELYFNQLVEEIETGVKAGIDVILPRLNPNETILDDKSHPTNVFPDDKVFATAENYLEVDFDSILGDDGGNSLIILPRASKLNSVNVDKKLRISKLMRISNARKKIQYGDGDLSINENPSDPTPSLSNEVKCESTDSIVPNDTVSASSNIILSEPVNMVVDSTEQLMEDLPTTLTTKDGNSEVKNERATDNGVDNRHTDSSTVQKEESEYEYYYEDANGASVPASVEEYVTYQMSVLDHSLAPPQKLPHLDQITDQIVDSHVPVVSHVSGNVELEPISHLDIETSKSTKRVKLVHDKDSKLHSLLPSPQSSLLNSLSHYSQSTSLPPTPKIRLKLGSGEMGVSVNSAPLNNFVKTNFPDLSLLTSPNQLMKEELGEVKVVDSAHSILSNESGDSDKTIHSISGSLDHSKSSTPDNKSTENQINVDLSRFMSDRVSHLISNRIAVNDSLSFNDIVSLGLKDVELTTNNESVKLQDILNITSPASSTSSLCSLNERKDKIGNMHKSIFYTHHNSTPSSDSSVSYVTNGYSEKMFQTYLGFGYDFIDRVDRFAEMHKSIHLRHEMPSLSSSEDSNGETYPMLFSDAVKDLPINYIIQNHFPSINADLAPESDRDSSVSISDVPSPVLPVSISVKKDELLSLVDSKNALKKTIPSHVVKQKGLQNTMSHISLIVDVVLGAHVKNRDDGRKKKINKNDVDDLHSLYKVSLYDYLDLVGFFEGCETHGDLPASTPDSYDVSRSSAFPSTSDEVANSSLDSSTASLSGKTPISSSPLVSAEINSSLSSSHLSKDSEDYSVSTGRSVETEKYHDQSMDDSIDYGDVVYPTDVDSRTSNMSSNYNVNTKFRQSSNTTAANNVGSSDAVRTLAGEHKEKGKSTITLTIPHRLITSSSNSSHNSRASTSSLSNKSTNLPINPLPNVSPTNVSLIAPNPVSANPPSASAFSGKPPTSLVQSHSSSSSSGNTTQRASPDPTLSSPWPSHHESRSSQHQFPTISQPSMLVSPTASTQSPYSSTSTSSLLSSTAKKPVLPSSQTTTGLSSGLFNTPHNNIAPNRPSLSSTISSVSSLGSVNRTQTKHFSSASGVSSQLGPIMSSFQHSSIPPSLSPFNKSSSNAIFSPQLVIPSTSTSNLNNLGLNNLNNPYSNQSLKSGSNIIPNTSNNNFNLSRISSSSKNIPSSSLSLPLGSLNSLGSVGLNRTSGNVMNTSTKMDSNVSSKSMFSSSLISPISQNNSVSNIHSSQLYSNQLSSGQSLNSNTMSTMAVAASPSMESGPKPFTPLNAMFNSNRMVNNSGNSVTADKRDGTHPFSNVINNPSNSNI